MGNLNQKISKRQSRQCPKTSRRKKLAHSFQPSLVESQVDARLVQHTQPNTLKQSFSSIKARFSQLHSTRCERRTAKMECWASIEATARCCSSRFQGTTSPSECSPCWRT